MATFLTGVFNSEDGGTNWTELYGLYGAAIRYQLPQTGKVELSIHNIMGQKVKILV